MLQKIIQQARQITEGKELLELVQTHHHSPIHTAIIIENCIRAGKYNNLSSSIDKVFLQQFNRRDKKLRSIVLNACNELHINTQSLIKRFEQPHFFTVALKHEAIALDTLYDTKAQEYTLHRNEYHELTLRDKETAQRETHITKHLAFQQQVFDHDTHKIKQTLVDHGYKIDTLHTIKKPTPILAVSDGSVYNKNQEEITDYNNIQKLGFIQGLTNSPYFYLYADKDKDIAIGKHKYRQSIISYTSPLARQLRFTAPSEKETIRADVIINQRLCQKILFHAQDNNDNNQYYHTNQAYKKHKTDLLTSHFYNQESGLADISHLVSLHQDDVFRVSTKGTSLVEGVSGSGKTNLIFHRVDYLIQQFPDLYDPNKIAIITPNKLLEDYLLYSLEKSVFSFKENIKTFHRATWSDSKMPSIMITDQQKKAFLDDITHLQKIIQNKRQQQQGFMKKSIDDGIEKLSSQLLTARSSYQEKDRGLLADFCAGRETIKSNTEEKNVLETITALKKLQQTSWYVTKEMKGGVNVSQWRYYHEGFFQQLETTIQSATQSTQRELCNAQVERDQLLSHQDAETKHLYQMIFEEKQNKLLSISSNFPSFDYVLIDEFQDFHPRALILIYECYGDQMVFSGDFMQSQRYQSLDEVKSYNIGIVEHKQMTDNFRNTREILQHTHQIFGSEKEHLFLAQRVVKRGEAVRSTNYVSRETFHKQINEQIQTLTLRSNDTVAIIYHQLTNAHQWHQQYNGNITVSFPHTTDDQSFFTAQCRIVSYQQAKGLEFDHVILIDAEQLLSSGLAYAKKRYYIGCTRATKTLQLINLHTTSSK